MERSTDLTSAGSVCGRSARVIASGNGGWQAPPLRSGDSVVSVAAADSITACRFESSGGQPVAATGSLAPALAAGPYGSALQGYRVELRQQAAVTRSGKDGSLQQSNVTVATQHASGPCVQAAWTLRLWSAGDDRRTGHSRARRADRAGHLGVRSHAAE